MDPSMGGPNSSPMGIVPGDHDPSMPLPPGGMNPGGGPPGPGPNGAGFSKNSPIMGVPTTNDPHYAQQYHNFQQQLYASNKSSPGGPQFFPGGGGPGNPHSLGGNSSEGTVNLLFQNVLLRIRSASKYRVFESFEDNAARE